MYYKLLTVLGLGFGQGLYALDAADGETESPSAVRVLPLTQDGIMKTISDHQRPRASLVRVPCHYWP